MVALVGRGLTNQEIADELHRSLRTVKNTLYRAYHKLGVRNRTQAVVLAISRGDLGIHSIISPDEMAEMVLYMPPEVMAEIAQRVERNGGEGHIYSTNESIQVPAAAEEDLDSLMAGLEVQTVAGSG